MRYELTIFGGTQPLNAINDNVDVEVRLDDGSRWCATFFTVESLNALFAKNRVTGECANGLYLWAAEMIVVERLDEAVIRATIDDLVDSGELEDAFGRLPDD